MVVSLFPQSYLTSDQVLAIVGEGQSTEGSPETQTQFNTILVPTAIYKTQCCMFTGQVEQVVLPGRVDDVTLLVLLWVKKHNNATETHRSKNIKKT